MTDNHKESRCIISCIVLAAKTFLMHPTSLLLSTVHDAAKEGFRWSGAWSSSWTE